MSHDLFSASSTATWIECSYSAIHAVPDAPKKESTIIAADTGKEKHEDMEAGNVADVEAFLVQLEDGQTYREMRVRLTNNCGGTIDIYNDGLDVATILDGKFGKWDVEAFHNMQLLTYSACLLSSSSAKWFRLVIFQPHGLDEEPWKQWVASRAEVEAHEQRVLRAIARTPTPNPGPQCRWCKAFQVCPAMHTDAGFVMGAMSRRVEDLTTEELVRLLRLIRALGDVKDVYEDALTTHLKLGRTADGVALKPSRSFRAWNDPTQAATYLHQHFGPKGVKPVSPAQAEKLGFIGKQYATVGAHKPEGQLKAVY